MKITKSQIAIIVIIVLSFAVSIYFYPQLPDRMASHWNARGEVDGYMSKAAGAFIMPVVMTVTVLMFLVILRIDPLKKNIEKFKSYYFGFIIAMCLFLFGIHCWMMLWNIGIKVSVNRVMPAAIGALYFFIGYIMKNFKRNWFMGIRTPWTLSNELVWKKTHEVSGRLFMASSVIAMCGMFFPEYSIWLIMVPILATAVFSIVYSYVLYRKVTKAGSGSTAEEMKIESSGDTTWDNLKEGYLYQVEKSLMKVKHPAKKQVLEDVSAHLDMKYAELSEEKRDWENYQGIITDMGPAEDYAELLDGEAPKSNKKLTLLSVVIVAAVVVIAIVFMPHFIIKYTEIVSDRIEDNIDFPFADDPEVIGVWESVDFVENIGDFAPDQKRWGGELFLNELKFYENGRILHVNDNAKDGFWLKWTRGIVMCSDDKTAEKYHIQEIGGEKYMFYEWKSGDYTIRHQKPSYYVLKKVPVGNTIIADQGTKEGIGSAYAWFELIDNGRYGESWEEAASIFKAHVSQAQWEKALEAIYTPLGKVIDREVISQTPTKSVPGAPDGNYVIIQFRTEFENKKGAIETVTPMLEKNGQWRVSGYFIK